MCRFKSGIILHNKIVIAQGADDSHSNLLRAMGIGDDYLGATKTFVRAELVPPNDEWWTDPETWEFAVDQDIVPDWFEQATYEADFKAQVHKWWQEHVHTADVDVLSTGYHRIKDCRVNTLCGDVIANLYGSSQVGEMHGGSQVGRMYGSSQVGEMYGSSQVGKMYGSSQVGEMYGSAIAIDYRLYPDIKVIVANSATCTIARHNEATNEQGS